MSNQNHNNNDPWTHQHGHPPDQQWAPPQAEQTKSTLAVIHDWYITADGQRELAELLPTNLPPELARHMVIAWASAVADNEGLLTCTEASLKRTLQDCARIGLWPGPAGHVFLIPYKQQATAQIGWKGVVAMLKRDTPVIRVDSGAIHENDGYSIRQGTKPDLEIFPAFGHDEDRGKPIAWYAVAHFGDGGPPQFEVMTEEEMKKHKQQYGARKRDGTFKAWATAYEEMARKTVIKRLAKHVGAGDVLSWAMTELDHTTALSAPSVEAGPAPQSLTETQQQIRERMGR